MNTKQRKERNLSQEVIDTRLVNRLLYKYSKDEPTITLDLFSNVDNGTWPSGNKVLLLSIYKKGEFINSVPTFREMKELRKIDINGKNIQIFRKVL